MAADVEENETCECPLYLVPHQQGLRVMRLFVLQAVSSGLHTFGFDVNVTSVSGMTEQKTTGRSNKAETLPLS